MNKKIILISREEVYFNQDYFLKIDKMTYLVKLKSLKINIKNNNLTYNQMKRIISKKLFVILITSILKLK